jgi:hypothetical protein
VYAYRNEAMREWLFSQDPALKEADRKDGDDEAPGGQAGFAQRGCAGPQRVSQTASAQLSP